MTYDHELTLISSTITKDEIGQDIETPIKQIILCGIKSVSETKFYSAAQAGLKPTKKFVVHGYEYNGETKVIFEGKEYTVIRDYSEDFEEVELTCERVGANG